MMEPIEPITNSNKDIDGINWFPYVGKWVITKSLHIHVVAKPSWLHRSMARLLLGWEWEEKK
jgi:hypothetical protein